ncbi:Tol-Pal system protein TolB [Helicobacter kayseriensis]|uniref:Tol-Pal system protein TolB n=1 Tax=Helicobacter kayseriensis TaxID=2905877 RepID=UPI001E579503|nr:Tol-Pal system protein TolB [Helicobacter kayseriensis]MCE3046883.1 Tol-Pal system protein TolB [Helicobacter kayseriensis]MCE3048457.1 Tol-Pal system protein TolB [Helicobacter kayseriensis]
MNRVIVICLLLCVRIFYGADAKLEIVKGQKYLPLIAIHNVGNDLEKKIANMLAKDLEVSGNFKISLQSKEIQNQPNYLLYQAQQIDLLANVIQQGNEVRLDFFDVNAKKKLLSEKFSLSEKSLFPFIAHRMANVINDYFKAPSIKWMEGKVVFAKLIAPSKSAIVIADYTLTFQETIINDGLNIFPKWADEKQESLFFTKYLDRPTILKYNLKNKKFERILSSQGMAVVSDVSSDYKKLLVSMAPIGQADVYLYDLEAKSTTKLTNYPGIDVGANFIEDKKKIIFISDRLGYPNVFLMNENGSGVEQAVFHGRNNSSVASNGKYIAYSSREEKNEFGSSIFNLYLMESGSSAIRRLTLNGANQMPRFSRDGENVMFLKNANNQSSLGLVRLRYNKTFLFPIRGVKIQSFDW